MNFPCKRISSIKLCELSDTVGLIHNLYKAIISLCVLIVLLKSILNIDSISAAAVIWESIASAWIVGFYWICSEILGINILYKGTGLACDIGNLLVGSDVYFISGVDLR